MSLTTFAQVKAATCRVVCPGGVSGTGYLVSPGRIVTCAHVVKDVSAGEPVEAWFPDLEGARTATLTDDLDETYDIAVLALSEPLTVVIPLRFGQVVERRHVWEGYGYPYLAHEQGLPLDGTIDDPRNTDRDNVDSIVLTADKLAAGVASKPHGFSGSPVVVGGLVIGHLKRILEDDDFAGHVAFGTVYAARAEDIVRVLGLEETLPVASPSRGTRALPATPVDGFDVFLSASGNELPRASELAQALRDRSLRVYFPTADYVHGRPFPDAVADAIGRSRASVILFSGQWPVEAAIEARLLWAHRETVPLIPVLPDGGELPHPWSDFLPIDLRGRGPTGPAFERLTYAVTGQSAPYALVAQDLGQMLTQSVRPATTIANARRLIAVGNVRRALDILPHNSAELDIRRLRALALSKAGDTDEAIEILRTLRCEGVMDAETGGILGGCYRRKFNKTRRAEWLELALDAYKEAFDRSGDTYPGINTASLLLGFGRVDESRKVAAQVLSSLDALPADKVDHWTHATRAEALLIRGEVDTARSTYRRAVRRDIEAIQDIAVMRQGARRTLLALRRSAEELDEVFPVPQPLAFVGHAIDLPGRTPERFPRRIEGAVREAIRSALDRLGGSLGLASATVGGDTIFLEEVLRREGRVRVLLPCPENQFLEQFVVRPDRKYEVRRILRDARADVIVQPSQDDTVDVWSDFAPRLGEKAEEWATALDERPRLLALWDGRGSYLETVIEHWQAQRWEVETITLSAASLSQRR